MHKQQGLRAALLSAAGMEPLKTGYFLFRSVRPVQPFRPEAIWSVNISP